jgi:hypothetical protein
MKRITAVFHPQVWIDGDAHEVDVSDPTTFDVTSAVTELGKSVALGLRDDDFYTDRLVWMSKSQPWMAEWSGPFWVEVEASIKEYYDNV